jgi:alkanesulfonate monooxygenase SsuD/methylene tetrahydromethanopterin reductase-like flavin-dependent oxidoreductase (luciferase family)
MMPNHPPGRDYAEGHYHNLDYLEFLDGIGFTEAWIGEHFTVKREPLPAPDLLIAQALLKTENIVLAPGAHILPYHHPAELAHRVAWLDHMAKGRFMLGVGSGGVSTDWAMFDVDGPAGDAREMTGESLDIMMKFWASEEPFRYEGKYWTATRPEDEANGNFAFHLKPYQDPHPPIGIAGLSPSSPTLELAGTRGLLPLSLCLGSAYLADHWQTYSRAAEAAGRTPSRADWRVGAEVYIADTDAEARERALNSLMGESYRNYLLPLFHHFGMASAFKHHPDVPDSDVTVEYLADHCWITGAPETVINKLGETVEASGGFGTLLVLGYDHLDNMTSWRESMSALMTEVAPKFKDLGLAAE